MTMDPLARKLIEDQQRRLAEDRAFEDRWDRLLRDADRKVWREMLEGRARLRALAVTEQDELLALVERQRLGLATPADLARIGALTSGDR